MRKITFLVMTSLAVVSLLLAACGAEPTQPPTAVPTKVDVKPTDTVPPPPPAPTTLIVAMNIDGILTLDPAYAFEIEPPVMMNATYDSLVETLPDDLNEFKPRLADKWDVTSDGLVYTFYLHPGVKFTSGNPVAAEDVRFSWQRLINVKGSGAYYLEMVDKMEVIDDLTIKVTLKRPSPEFMSAVSTQLCGITDSKVVKEQGGTDAADADQTDKAKDYLDQHSAGSGPYIQTSWTPKSELVLEANPNYWRGAPEIDKIIFKNVTDPTVAFQMLQTGEADLVYSLDVDLAQQAAADPNLAVVPGQMYNLEYIAMTSSKDLSEPLTDVRVKRAIMHAIDFDGIIQGILGGYAIRAPGVVPWGVIGSDPDANWVRDLDKARDLLKEAGYENGFSVDLSYGTNPVRDLVAAKVQADLAEVGIEVQLKPLEMAVYFSEARAQKLAFLIGPYATDRMDPSNWTSYMSYCDSGVSKRMFYCNPESERLANLVASEMDPQKRAQAVKDLNATWIGDAWATILYQQQQIVAMNKKLQGFQYHPFVLCYFDWLTLAD